MSVGTSYSAVRRVYREILEVDTNEILWDKSARLRVLIDITKSIRRVQRFSLKNGVPALVEIKYERLPTFCFLCGLIGHIGRDCVEVPEEDKEGDRQWGAWLRASPKRGRQKMEEEVRGFLKGARVLEFRRMEEGHMVRAKQGDLKEGGKVCTLATTKESWASGATSVLAREGAAGVAAQGTVDVAVEAAVTDVCDGVGGMQVPKTVRSSMDVVDKIPCAFHNSLYSFVAGEGKVATKVKKPKHKLWLPKLVGEVLIENRNVSPCNIDSGGKVGDKRRMVDNMIVDDIHDSDNLSSKKPKLNDFSDNDNNVDIVEAEVGCNLPCQAL